MSSSAARSRFTVQAGQSAAKLLEGRAQLVFNKCDICTPVFRCVNAFDPQIGVMPGGRVLAHFLNGSAPLQAKLTAMPGLFQLGEQRGDVSVKHFDVGLLLADVGVVLSERTREQRDVAADAEYGDHLGPVLTYFEKFPVESIALDAVALLVDLLQGQRRRSVEAPVVRRHDIAHSGHGGKEAFHIGAQAHELIGALLHLP